ncbi:MAG TPA: PepSY domain-containing protein [Gemmatimonadales bacterium]|nr:PepSY domain-containing protein [Gemmatimonadales bacterium]
MRFHLFNRKIHYWVSVAIALPALVVVTSGILLQLKKHWTWVQPPEQRGSGTSPRIGMSDILAASRSVPEAGVLTWSDVQRVDIRPDRGVAKVTSRTRWEVQVDTETGRVLQVAPRRSDLIESIHDGSWFHDYAKLWIFLPNGVLLLLLWGTGLYLAWLPYQVRARRRGAP